MVQLFSPTSGSQELIAVVGSAQHKSLACCIAYRQGPGKRNSELLNAPPALPWHNDQVKQSAPTKGAQRAHNSLLNKKEQGVFKLFTL